MPGIDAIEAPRTIGRAGPAVGGLILTMYDADDRVFQAMRAGARGYVVTSAAPEVVLDAVRTVGLVRDAGARARTTGPAAPREREVLELMARGRDNASIAAALGVSPKTARNVVSSVFVTLPVADRQAAIARAKAGALG